jgi:predicted secreted protein
MAYELLINAFFCCGSRTLAEATKVKIKIISHRAAPQNNNLGKAIILTIYITVFVNRGRHFGARESV